MSIEVKTFNIKKARLEVRSCPEIVRDYVRLLEESNKRWEDLTKQAVNKLKSSNPPCVKVPRHDLLKDCEGIEKNYHVFDKNGFCIFCGNTIEQCKK